MNLLYKLINLSCRFLQMHKNIFGLVDQLTNIIDSLIKSHMTSSQSIDKLVESKSLLRNTNTCSDMVYLCVENLMILNRYLGNDYPRDILFFINKTYHKLHGIDEIGLGRMGTTYTWSNGNTSRGWTRVKF